MIIPKKSLGQNFLIDKNIILKIINLTKINNENILEVGPGLGALTSEIIKLKPKQLILIEKDINLFQILNEKYFDHKNVKILNVDAMDFDYKTLPNFKIISNLPYNISSKFLLKTFRLNNNIKEIICMIQKELADKFDYSCGKMNKYKFLSKYCGEYNIEFNVSNNVFHPKPKVQSRVIKFITNKKNIDTSKLDFFINNFFFL